MIKYATDDKESFEGKRVAISGSGNVAQCMCIAKRDACCA